MNTLLNMSPWRLRAAAMAVVVSLSMLTAAETASADESPKARPPLMTRDLAGVPGKEAIAVTENVLGDLRQNDGMPVFIPDLSSVGLTFKRVQRLSFHNQAVVQIVYLPEHGDPVALCLTQDARRDEVPHSREVNDMQTVAWRHGHVDYLLLARGLQLDLADIGRRIAQGQVANLYGRVEYIISAAYVAV
jgi:hypothetical protein